MSREAALMQLLWPGFLLLLALPVLLVAGYAWRQRRRRPAAVRYSSLSLLRAASPRHGWRRHAPFGLFAIGSAGLVLALARPAAIVSVPASQVTIVLAMDVSGSMCSTDIAPSRLEAAEQAASQFVQRQGASTQIAVVAFSGFAELVQAPTNDQELLQDAIRSLTTGRRTAIGSGILAAIDAIAEIDPAVPRSQADTSGVGAPPPTATGAYVPDIIVLLTDGANNAGPLPVDAAQQAKDRGIRVYTIGFGTARGGGLGASCAAQFLGNEPFQGGFGGFGGGGGIGGFRRGIDEETLKQVASMTGGQYYPAESAGELQKVFDNLPTSLITKHEVMDITVFFLAGAAGVLVLAFVLAQAWRPLPG